MGSFGEPGGAAALRELEARAKLVARLAATVTASERGAEVGDGVGVLEPTGRLL